MSSSCKVNKAWQQKLLKPQSVFMVEAILLAATIFWDPNFMMCNRHTLNLTKKLGLKKKNLKVEIVKERIEQILDNKTIAKLNLLFTNNPDWWHFIAIIFTQPLTQSLMKNLKQ